MAVQMVVLRVAHSAVQTVAQLAGLKVAQKAFQLAAQTGDQMADYLEMPWALRRAIAWEQAKALLLELVSVSGLSSRE